ncbi:isopentenyl transferase family protein [Mesorhizobium sp. M0152]|uniref:isopentenyl transferase family protein n=1 Tax=Mesorhizobium sp. M0152 TaxID=2956898 RepID=UPI0033398D22
MTTTPAAGVPWIPNCNLSSGFTWIRPLTAGIIHAVTAHRKRSCTWLSVDLSLGSSSKPARSRFSIHMRESASGWRFQWHVRRLRLGNSDAFLERAKRRVTDMFVPRQGRPSSLQELAAHWNEDAVRPTLEDVDGYLCAIRFASEHSLTISENAAASQRAPITLAGTRLSRMAA